MKKSILWDEKTGTVYWKSNGEIFFSPMSKDNTCDMYEGGVVDCWDSKETEQRIKELLA